MARLEVVQGVRDLLTLHWDKCDVAYPNEGGEAPANDDPWILVQFAGANTQRKSVTTRYYQEEGGVRLLVNVVRGEGANRALEWCKELADIFRDQAFGGVKFLVPGSPNLDDDNDEGKYCTVAFVIPYTFDFIG